VRINIAALQDRAKGQALVQEANRLVAEAAQAVARATTAVEKHL
jgi:hypothetical protein